MKPARSPKADRRSQDAQRDPAQSEVRGHGTAQVDRVSDLEDFARFVAAQSHLLGRKPALTFQQAANEPDSTAPARVAHRRIEAGLEARPWLQYVNKPQCHSACLMTLVGHTGSVKTCAFSPNGSRIVSSSQDGTLKLWDAQTGAELATFAGAASARQACAFSPDGRRIVSAASWRELQLSDADTGAKLATLAGHADKLKAWAFSPDGRRIVSASEDKTLKLWDAQTGALLATLEGHTDSVEACAFSVDGKRMASGSQDKTLKLWDTQTGALLATLSGHTSRVWACAFSSGGSRIVSASGDKTLKLWDAQTGAELATLAGHTSSMRVTACAFYPLAAASCRLPTSSCFGMPRQEPSWPPLRATRERYRRASFRPMGAASFLLPRIAP